MSARCAMDSVQIRQTRPRETTQYRHPYGGLARDGFARFFDIPVEYVDEMPVNMKCMDRFFDKVEVCGYVHEYYETPGYGDGMTWTKHTLYRITIIDFHSPNIIPVVE